MDVIVAADKNWGIGFNGTQPFVVPEDRAHFRRVTGSGTVIVGRKTLLDFPGGRPLKGRRNIVLTRDPNFTVDGAEVAHSVEEAFSLLADDEQVFVIGGDSIYRQLVPCCDRAYVTRIESDLPADSFFPNLDSLPQWELEVRGEDREFEGTVYHFDTYVNITRINPEEDY